MQGAAHTATTSTITQPRMCACAATVTETWEINEPARLYCTVY